MPHRTSDSLRVELYRYGFSRAYIDRVDAEFTDHAWMIRRDAMIAGISAKKLDHHVAVRLGDRRSLALAIIRRHRVRTLVHRIPIVSLVIVPILTLWISLFVFMFGVGAATLAVIRGLGIEPSSPTNRWLFTSLFDLGVLGLIGAVTLFACVAAVRFGVSRTRLVCSCLAIAVFAGVISINLTMPLSPGGQGFVWFAVAGPVQLGQSATSLLVLTVVLACARRRVESVGMVR